MVVLIMMAVCARVEILALRRQTRASCSEGVRQGLVRLIELYFTFRISFRVLIMGVETSHLLLGSSIFSRSCIAL
jgi:hypothetical protein